MRTAEENEAQARAAYAAFAAGDIEQVKSVFHPDIVWHMPGSSPLSGDYRGIDAVGGLFMKIFTETDGTFSNTVEEVVANEATTVVISKIHAERKGKAIDAAQVALYRIDSDGKVTESTFYGDDSSLFDAFWA